MPKLLLPGPASFAVGDIWYGDGSDLYRRNLETMVKTHVFEFQDDIWRIYTHPSMPCIVTGKVQRKRFIMRVWTWNDTEWVEGTDAGYIPCLRQGPYRISCNVQDPKSWVSCKSRAQGRLERLLGVAAKQIVAHS